MLCRGLRNSHHRRPLKIALRQDLVVQGQQMGGERTVFHAYFYPWTQHLYICIHVLARACVVRPLLGQRLRLYMQDGVVWPFASEPGVRLPNELSKLGYYSQLDLELVTEMPSSCRVLQAVPFIGCLLHVRIQCRGEV